MRRLVGLNARKLGLMSKTQMSSPVAISAGLALVALSLTGCVRFSVDLTVTPSDEVNGSIVFAYPETMSLLFESDSDIAGLQESYRSVDGAVERGYDQDGFVGSEIRFREVSIESFSSPHAGRAPLTIVRTGDEIDVEGVFDFSGYEAQSDSEVDSFTAASVSRDLGDMYVSIVLPGEILDTNGVVSEADNRVSWRLQLGQENSLYATALAPEPTPEWLWWAVFGGAGVLAGLIALLITRSRRRKPPADAFEPGRVPTGPTG